MNNQIIDLTHMRFGRLVVLHRSPINSKSGNAIWVCLCDCGNQVNVIGSHLRSGHTVSCGCNRTTENANGHSKERLYRIWRGMINRCTNLRNVNFKWYGGRGISVCSEWLKYDAFRRWALASGYTDTMTIDRVDLGGNYCPENCRWVDMKTQANNRTNNRNIRFQGEVYTVAQLAETFGISSATIFNRLRLGWTPERIISTPERSTKRYGSTQKV